MIYTRKTEDGGFGFGFIENADDLRELADAIDDILDDDKEEEEKTHTQPEELESEHQITVGYDDDTDVTYVTYDPPISEHAVPCALLRAAASMWPVHDDWDKEIKKLLHEWADLRGELDDVEDSE